MSVYKLTCMLKEEPNVLFPLLLPLQFKWSANQTITWEDGKIRFKIVPFSTRGRETTGYRVHFEGDAISCQYLMDRFLGGFNPSISGIEWVQSSDKSQSELINLAKSAGYRNCSLPGIYEHNDVGIILMPTNDVHLQVRNREITIRNLSTIITSIEETASVFLAKPLDLFSYSDETVFS